MLLERRLVRQHAVQRTVHAVVIDLLGRHAQQVFERRLAVDVFRQGQITRGRAQPQEHVDRGEIRPAHVLTTLRQKRVEHLVQPQRAPQRQREEDIAEAPRALDRELLQLDLCRRVVGVIRRLEQRRLTALARDPLGQPLGLVAPTSVEAPERRDHFLTHPPPLAHRAHEQPVGVPLAVLPHAGVTQVHDSSSVPLLSCS